MESLNSVKFVTLTNNGYIDYTLNCLKSLELINFQKPLHCYTLGEESHNILQSKGYKSSMLKTDNDDDTKFGKFRTGNWHNIVKKKFDLIHNELIKNKFVCFTDGDIVYLNKDFMNYCLEHIQDNDIIIQNDNMHHGNTWLCSGFMFIKSSEKTIEVFNPKSVEKDIKPGWGDQNYINKIKNQLKVAVLPLQLFPNGRYYYRSHDPSFDVDCKEPMMIHFNWLRGHEKKEKMIKHNKWYL